MAGGADTGGVEAWRVRLLLVVLVGAVGGYAWMFAASPHLRPSLTLLSAVFVAGTGAVLARNRARLSWRLLSSTVALGAVVHLAAAGLVVAGDRLWQLGLVPALAANWLYFLLGLLGVGAALFTWTRARGSHGDGSGASTVVVHGTPEPPPPESPELSAPPSFAALTEVLRARQDGPRLRTLQVLQRIDAALAGDGEDEDPLAAGRRVVWQEARRLDTESAAARREDEASDLLSKAASFAEWGIDKIPELADMDAADLLMAKVVADINTRHDRVEHRFVDLSRLAPFHPIDRPTAEDKAERRAEAAREALPLLRANGMRLSEELVVAHDALEAFRSVTGFQVVELDDGSLVTFEGNGRREALQRAFGDESLQVEVRVFCFDDPEVRRTIQRRVQRVRRWMDVAEE